MAFSSLIDDTRRMNAKMIAMGQSIDIQKMPRPKAGSQVAQKQAMYTPSGTDVEKMLYPKNFKPRAFEEPETKVSPKEETVTQAEIEIIGEAIEEEKVTPKIIGDEDMLSAPVQRAAPQEVIANGETKKISDKPWENCMHFKVQGSREFCKEYLGWCVRGKCTRPKFR